MRALVALVVLAGCDKLFLQENPLAVDAAEIDGPPTPGCPPEFAGGRYYLLNARLIWQEAEATCRSLGGTYSHLAVVPDVAEAAVVGALIPDNNGDHWIGLTRLGEPTVFHWITKEPVEIPWLTGQPDGDGACGRIDPAGIGVADTKCDDERRAVCECDDFPVERTRF